MSEKEKTVGIKAGGKKVTDEQGFLIRELIASKMRWLKNNPKAFIVWLEGLHGWIGRQIEYEKEQMKDKEDGGE